MDLTLLIALNDNNKKEIEDLLSQDISKMKLSEIQERIATLKALEPRVSWSPELFEKLQLKLIDCFNLRNELRATFPHN